MKTAQMRARVLTNGPKREAKKQRGWRLRESLVDFIAKRAEKSGRYGAETQLVEDALDIYRELDPVLTDDRLRLVRAATDMELDFSTDAPRVIRAVLVAGLEALEAKRKR